METWELESGFELPRVGLGTWEIGGGTEADHSNDEFSIQSIKNAIEMGYTHIDIAEMYGAGHTEELVGEAIKSFDRDDLIIATKVSSVHLGYDDLLNAAESSLKRLGLDYVDLYYIHAPNPDVPLKETMRAMDKLVSDGLTKNIAVSNFTVDLIAEAQSALKNKIVANQTEYNLLVREQGWYGGNKRMESEIVPYCQENDIMIVVMRPIAKGELLKPNEVMDELAKKYDKTRAQIAINWLISQKNVVAIPMSQNADHQKENLGASGWSMDEKDSKRLGEAYETT